MSWVDIIKFIIATILIQPQLMYNSFKYHKKPINQKELRILDYRNAKYQGSISGINLIKNGHALLFDQNYLFVMANWQNAKIAGHSFIVYPDDSIFYGFISNNSPANFCCFQLKKKVQIYSLIEADDQIIFIIDFFPSKSLSCFSIARPLIEQILSAPSSNQYLLLQQLKKQKGKVQLKAEAKYQNQQQKWQFLEDHFRKAIKPELYTYKSFIKQLFVTQNQQSIRLTEHKNQVDITCGTSSSIFCKISCETQNQNDIKIKSLGFYNQNEKLVQMFKKSVNGIIEEGLSGQVKTYSELQRKRPLDCLTRIQKYFKKSMNFVNEFIQLDYLYGINYLYHSIEQCCQQVYSTKYAQQLLFRQSHHPQQPTPSKGGVAHKTSLQEAKEDIYRAAHMKSRSGNKSLSHSNIRSRPLKNSFYDHYKGQQITSEWNQFTSPAAVKRKEKKYIEDSHLQQRRKQKSVSKYRAAKLYYNRDEDDKRRQGHNRSQMGYLQGNKEQRQNLGQLTKHYLAIEEELKRSMSSKARRNNKYKM